MSASVGNPEPTAPAFTGPWAQSEEWQVMESAIRRDTAPLERAAADSGVPARLIAANLVAEQLRLFFTDREDYKKFFYPLKILGPQSQFSWGVMGMKEATAVQVENNLKNPDSPYYPGAQYEHLLDFPPGTKDINGARFTRMTDQHDHYWSYLYAGLYIKEVEAQWAKAGFPIEGNVAVISTLYNIGFTHSVPNANPQVGGAGITLSDGTHAFGALASEFYDSDLLTDILFIFKLQLRKAAPVIQHLSAVHVIQPDHAFQQRRFSRSAFADDHIRFTGLECKSNIIQHLAAGKGF